MFGILDFPGPMKYVDRLFRFDDLLCKVLYDSAKAPNFSLEVLDHTRL